MTTFIKILKKHIGCSYQHYSMPADCSNNTTSSTLHVRNSVRLTRLCADERLGLVFAIDYLVGVENADGSVANAQLVMLCWNAWCPYRNGAFTLADTICVPMVGGPRPNADDMLCFKSLFRGDNVASPSAATNVLDGTDMQMQLRFNFVLVNLLVRDLDNWCCCFYYIKFGGFVG